MSTPCLFNGILTSMGPVPPLSSEVGLIESMLWVDGEMPLLELHLERLKRGVSALGLAPTMPMAFESLSEAISELGKAREVQRFARVRLITYGKPNANLLVTVEALNQDPLENNTGLTVAVSDDRLQPGEMAQFKLLNSPAHERARLMMKELHLDEVLLMNGAGNIVEGANSNLFLSRSKRLITPPLSEGCVDGIMRCVIKEIAEARGTELVERPVRPEDVTQADEVWMTNAVRGIRWVQRLGRTEQPELASQVQKWIRLRVGLA